MNPCSVRVVADELPGFVEKNLDSERRMPVDRFSFPFAFEVIVACLYGIRQGFTMIYPPPGRRVSDEYRANVSQYNRCITVSSDSFKSS